MTDISIPTFHARPAWLITARSHLMDRIAPDHARIQLPEREVLGGTLSVGRGPLPAPPAPSRRLGGLGARRAPSPVQVPHRDTIDLRRNSPSNWAHFLNNHLPIVFEICRHLQIDPKDTCLVLPEKTPGYITGAAEMFGLTVLLTDAALEGEGIPFEVSPWTAIRPKRHEWVQNSCVADLLSRIDQAPKGPERVYLARKDTRAASNGAELEAHLAAKGYAKVYPEDLTPTDQMALFRHATQIVAIHGAGLAPLLYAQPGGRLTHLVEILHAGHMTDVYRVMAEQVGVHWIGVQGRLKPEYIREAYDFGQPYKAHSLDNFHVDLDALDIACETAGIG